MPPTRRSTRIKPQNNHQSNNTTQQKDITSKRKSTKQVNKSVADSDVNGNDDDEMLTGKTRQVSMSAFPYTLPYKRLNIRKMPHLYRPGKGEQGVLMVEPYKSELLPNWTFKDPDSARKSSQKLRGQFDQYLEQGDFIGADMARKFIQMGFTRSRRYANHKGGRKYAVNDDGTRGHQLPRSNVEDPIKAESAQIFKDVLEEIKVDQKYTKLRKEFEERYANTPIPIFKDEQNPVK